MNRQRWIFAGTALVIVIADILTKWIVVSNFRLHEVRQVVGDYIRLTYIHNPGAAFGMFPGSRVALVTISIAAILVVVWVAWRRPAKRATVFALGLILGGAIGNLIDRIRLGEVVDFIQVGVPPHYWPVFNVADSGVTVGVVWLALEMAFGGRKTQEAPELPAETTFGGVAPARDDG